MNTLPKMYQGGRVPIHAVRHSIAAQAPIPRCPAAACLHVRRDENGLESFNIPDIFSKMEGIGQIFSKTFRNKNEFKFFFSETKTNMINYYLRKLESVENILKTNSDLFGVVNDFSRSSKWQLFGFSLLCSSVYIYIYIYCVLRCLVKWRYFFSPML